MPGPSATTSNQHRRRNSLRPAGFGWRILGPSFWVAATLVLGPGTLPAQDGPVPIGLEPLLPLRPPEGRPTVHPEELAIDGLGRLFLLDRGGGTIFKVSPEKPGDPGWSAFGAGDQGGSRFPHLTGLFAQWGPDLFAMDPAAGVLYQFDLQGRLKRTLSYRPNLPPDRAGFIQPNDFGLTRSGELLLCDRAGGLITFDRYGRFLTEWTGGGEQHLLGPTRLAQDDAGRILLLDPPAAMVRCVSREGTPLASWRYDQGLREGEATEALMAVSPWNQIIVAGRSFGWIRLFDVQGRMLLHWTNPQPLRFSVTDLASGADSLLYLACPGCAEVPRFRWVFAARGGTDGP